MTNTAIRRTASAAIAALFVAVGAAMTVTPAHADPVYDEKFLSYLDKKGVPYKNKTEVIRTAKQFCLDVTRQGTPTWKVGYRLTKDQGWTEKEAEAFINAAIPTYCPQVWG